MTVERKRKRELPSRRIAWAALAAASASLLVGCGDTGSSSADEGKPRPSSSTPVSPSPTPHPSVSVDGANLGAMDTVLIYCAPGLPGSPRKGCDLGRVRDGVTEITQPVRKQVKADPDKKTHAAVASAAAGLDKAVEELKPCDAWFRGSSSDDVKNLGCGQSWTTLTGNWTSLKTALPWP